MKDFFNIFNRVAGKSYTAVSTNDRELQNLSGTKDRTGEIDTSVLEANLAECEGLNAKFSDDGDFAERQEAILDRWFQRNRKSGKKSQLRNSFSYLTLGFVSLAVALFILIAKPYDVLFKLKVVLSEGGEIYEIWRQPEVELYLRVYLFNVTNAEEFLAGKDKKLNLVEVGPYVYKESLEHTHVIFNDNATLSTIPIHPLKWVPELSGDRTEADVLYMPNIALLSIAHVAAKESWFFRTSISAAALLEKSLVQMTAKEFMFGYESSLVTLGNTLMQDWIPFDKLGLIDRMYDFKGDYETIFTGADNVSIAGLVDTYRGSKNLPQWNGEHCSSVQYASDGTKFKGHLDFGDQLIFYRKSLCRAAPLISIEEGVRSGMKAFKYVFPENMLDNGKFDERNKCFCRNGTRKCLPAGLIDVSGCYFDFPISLSYPHFYNGDEVLFKDVNGLNPQKEKHESSFWIQPESGLPLEVSVRIQINMALDDLSWISKTAAFSNMHLPLLWFEFKMFNLPQKMEDRFKLYLNILPIVEESAMYIMLIGGILIILLTVYRIAYIIMFRTSNRKNNIKSNILSTDMFNSKVDDIYSACEVPLNRKVIDLKIDQLNKNKPKKFLKSHSERIFDLKIKLSDKVTDSVSSVKERIKPHIKNIFVNNDVSISHPQLNIGYNSDLDENTFDTRVVIENDIDMNNTINGDNTNTNDGFDLEVIDDGSQFDEDLINMMNRRNSNWVETDRIIDYDDDNNA